MPNYAWKPGPQTRTFRKNRISSKIDKVCQISRLFEVKRYTAKDDLVFTDRPEYSFYADRLVAPDLAIIPAKRLASTLTPDEILEKLKLYKPKAILIVTHCWDIDCRDWLFDEYEAKKLTNQRFLYLRRPENIGPGRLTE